MSQRQLSHFAQRLWQVPQAERIGETCPLLKLDDGLTISYSQAITAAVSSHIERYRTHDAIPFNQTSGHEVYEQYSHHPASGGEEYWQHVALLANSIPAPTEDEHITVVMAVSGEHEENYVNRALGLYSTSTIRKNIGVIVYLNAADLMAPAAEETYAAAIRARDDPAATKIHIVADMLDHDVPLSTRKKKAVDIAINRWANNGASPANIIVCNDADGRWAAPDYAQLYTDAFKSDTQLLTAIQENDYDHDTFRNLDPMFVLGARIRRLFTRQMACNSGNYYPEGYDLAFRPSLYCSLGGFIPGMWQGVDYSFGKLVKDICGKGFTRLSAGSATIHTSARRPAYKYLTGQNNNGFTRSDDAANTAIRTMVLDDKSPAPYTHIKDRLQQEIPLLIAYFGNGSPIEIKTFYRALEYYGVDVNWQHLSVSGCAKFIDAYREAFNP